MGKRGKRNAKKIVLLVVLGVILAAIIAAAIFAVDVFRDVSGKKLNQSEFAQIEIVSGDTTRSIGKKLQQAGVIGYADVFRIMATMQSVDTKLQIGKYEFNVGQSYHSILHVLKQAPNYRESVRIGFAEGTEVTDIIDKFLAVGAEHGASWTKEGFEAALLADYSCVYIPAVGALPEGCPVYARLEGFLYPDTYDFFLDSTEEELFAKMIAQFNQKAASAGLEEKAAAANITVYDAMILGSIIQKESGNIADFAMISSVFNNRLDIDMKLQSDAAVSYMVPKDERLPSCTYQQLNTDTPYNVYMRKGLTPTPICCARIEAAVAACEPAESEYYYFIGTPDGQTIFAKTFAEHSDNIKKYLK